MRPFRLLLSPFLLPLLRPRYSTSVKATSTVPSMSTPAPDQQVNKGQNEPPLLLPDTNTANNGERVNQIPVDGSAVSLDHLGPMIINTDGTISRIDNWSAMTEGEQATTKRIITKRNAARLKVLQEKEAEEAKARTEL